MTDEQKTRVREVFESFLKRRAQKIKKLRFENLEINPFLIRLMSRELDLIDARSIVEWRVQQHWERGLVTAFGFALPRLQIAKF